MIARASLKPGRGKGSRRLIFARRDNRGVGSSWSEDGRGGRTERTVNPYGQADGDLREGRGGGRGGGGRLAPLCIPIDEIAPWPLRVAPMANQKAAMIHALRAKNCRIISADN